MRTARCESKEDDGLHAWPGFQVVEQPLLPSDGPPSMTLLSGAVMRLPLIAITALGHEVPHGWWTNGVNVDRS